MQDRVRVDLGSLDSQDTFKAPLWTIKYKPSGIRSACGLFMILAYNVKHSLSNYNYASLVDYGMLNTWLKVAYSKWSEFYKKDWQILTRYTWNLGHTNYQVFVENHI